MEPVQEERKIAVLSCQYMDPKLSLLHLQLQDFSRLFVIYYLFILFFITIKHVLY